MYDARIIHLRAPLGGILICPSNSVAGISTLAKIPGGGWEPTTKFQQKSGRMGLGGGLLEIMEPEGKTETEDLEVWEMGILQ